MNTCTLRRLCFCLLLPEFACTGPLRADEAWRPLLDASLSQWEIWTGVPHESVPITWEGKSTDGRTGRPLGLGRNERGIFTVSQESGEPVMRVSGEIYAGLTTLAEFGDYHLRLEFKWGEKKWPPRLDRLRDSGLLYHCTGEHGAFWNVWMRSLECQVQEGECGDLYLLGGPMARVRSTSPDEKTWPTFAVDADLLAVGPGGRPAVRHGPSSENLHGAWNVIEVMAVGDRAIHLVNGRVVLALENATIAVEGKRIPLTRGRLQLQSEGAELHYRRVEIRPLKGFPPEVARAAGWNSTK